MIFGVIDGILAMLVIDKFFDYDNKYKYISSKKQYYRYIGDNSSLKRHLEYYHDNKLKILKRRFDLKRSYFIVGDEITNIEIQTSGHMSDILEPIEEG